MSGPAVIDSDGRVNSVQDRCAHSLMSLPSVPNFHVLANFQERRRKDVSFLDSVTLRLDGSDIHLQQGGRVQVSYSHSHMSVRTLVPRLVLWCVSSL